MSVSATRPRPPAPTPALSICARRTKRRELGLPASAASRARATIRSESFHAKAGPGLDPERAVVRVNPAISVSQSGTPTSPPTACLRRRIGVHGVGNPPRQLADRAALGLEYRPAASDDAGRPPAPWAGRPVSPRTRPEAWRQGSAAAAAEPAAP